VLRLLDHGYCSLQTEDASHGRNFSLAFSCQSSTEVKGLFFMSDNIPQKLDEPTSLLAVEKRLMGTRWILLLL
jgi:hypothetical protein